MNERLDTQIQNALVPPPMDAAPSDELMRNLRTMAHTSKTRAPWWRSRLVPAGAAGAAALLVVAATLTPAKASAKSFDLIVAAAQNINAFQFSILSNEGGKRQSFTIAGIDGRVTMRSSDGPLMKFEPGAMSIYDPDEKKIMRLKFDGIEGAEDMAKEMGKGLAEGMKEMDLKKMLADYRQKYGSRGITVSPVRQEDGHAVYHVTLAAPDQPERVEMTVDAASDLPERLHVDSKDGGQEAVDMEMRYGSRVDPSLLRAEFPKGVPVEEIDLGSMVGDAMKGMNKASQHP